MAKVPELPKTERQLGQLDGLMNGPLPEELAPLPEEAARDAWMAEADRIRSLPYFREGCSMEPLELTHVGDFVLEPSVEHEWLVRDLLLAGGSSVLGGPPKAGKSTLALTLALSVTGGIPFLGRETTRGRVVLISLEEDRNQVRKQFQRMGAGGHDDLYLYVETVWPADLQWKVSLAIDKIQPALVIIDPLLKFERMKDINDYSVVNEAILPLHALARSTGAHILCLHHHRKGSGSGGEEVIGSTAFVGAFDTVMSLKRDDGGQRTLSSRNRYGIELPETVLTLTETRVEAAGTKADASTHAAVKKILEFLNTQFEPVGIPEIVEYVAMQKATVVQTLNAMTEGGRVTRTGAGRRNSPYLYSWRDAE